LVFNRKANKKLCSLLNELTKEHFKEECKHPKKYLQELPEQDNIHLYNRECKCLKCGAILMGYLGRN
jgi:hypothetical protein